MMVYCPRSIVSVFSKSNETDIASITLLTDHFPNEGIPMNKLDLIKQMPSLYHPSSKEISVVDVPEMNFLMMDGTGDPNSAPAYAEALTALYQLSYTIKFSLKKGKRAIDYRVMPLEGLWWMDDMRLFSMENKSAWKWTMMIAQPDFVAADLVEEARKEVAKKKNPPALALVKFEAYHEGPAAQILHIGPYNAEGPNIAKIHASIHASGHQLRGKHHEIYLSDPRRAAPEKLKTIVRQPFG
jgi:hypothetical protein